VFGSSNASKKMLPSTSYEGFAVPAGKIGVEEIDELEAVDFNVREFPPEYKFLLDLPAINESELRQHPVKTL
jgi:hypothetical protein